MSTAIQWTDETWNPTTGCTRVSEGCRHCYIERTPAFRMAGRKFVNGTTGVQLHPDRLDQPLHWKKPRRVFVNSLSDLFHEDIPDDFIKLALRVICAAPQHTFQVLTKRPERMRQFMEGTKHCDFLGDSWGRRVRRDYQLADEVLNTPIISLRPENLWLGVSVEDQKTADERIPLLLQTPAAVRFISAEPLLGPVNLSRYLRHQWPECSRNCLDDAGPGHGVSRICNHAYLPALDWVIAGGESGPKARPCDIHWIRSLVNQCQAAKVPVFVKQLGSHPTTCFMTRLPTDDWVKIQFPKDKKGGNPAEWPEDLQIREYPCGS